MKQKFCLFIQKHDIGTYTITLPGLPRVYLADEWDDEEPVTSRLAAYGLLLEEARDDLRQALGKWLAKAEPSMLHRYSNWKPGQHLEKVEVELRPSAREGRKRRDKVKILWSLLLEKSGGDDEEKQWLVRVPRLNDPPLSFYCYDKTELRETASRELAAYFSDSSFEEMQEFEHSRQETLDEIEVSFTPLKPQQEKKKKDDEDSEYSFWALKSSAENLTARVREGRITRAYRRERAIDEVLGVLSAERHSSLILTGRSGVGKTAIIHEVTRRIHEGNCPPELKDRKVWLTSANRLIAGCSYIGQWQEKLQNIVGEVKNKRHILAVDDIVGLMEAGKWSKGEENMAQYLRSFIADGTLTVIGETSPERLRLGENQDAGFLRLFRTLEIGETDENDTLSILHTMAAGLEREFSIRIQPDAQETALSLTRRFLPYRAFPGKAVAFLESAAAETGKQQATDKKDSSRSVVTPRTMIHVFARQTGLPEFILADHLTLDPEQVERHFSARLIGQPDAVETVVDLVTVIKAGLNDPAKPLGCYFFVGPTGVGKTEMAKALAEYLFGSAERLLRYDMSEYGEPMSAARLIGSAHGNEEGELTKRIRLQPFSVVLLDEFEKANAAIFDVMLQVLGEGRLTDAAGRTADFRSAIILMTSNLGASPREQRKPGIRLDESYAASALHFQSQLERFFRPEFVNRIDKVVTFRPLHRAAMRDIAARELNKLLEREGVARRHLLMEIDDDVIDLLLETGFSPQYGARPLKREIERRVITPLARYLVAHRIASSQLIEIKRAGDGLEIVSTNLATSKTKVKTAASALTQDGEQARSMSLTELTDGLAAYRRRLDEWHESETLREIRNENSQLLAQTQRSSFVSFGSEASRTWGRIYHLERLTKRLAQLKERAGYLEEFATLTRRDVRRDSSRYSSELAQSYTDLGRDVDYLEVELLCAHLRASDQAVLNIRALGRVTRGADEQSWPLLLAEMYLKWAKRKGYEFEVLVPVPTYVDWIQAQGFTISGYIPGYESGPLASPKWAAVKASDFRTLLERLNAMRPTELALAVRGVNVYGFLKGEAGTHKLLYRDSVNALSVPVQTAVVGVEPLDEDDAPAQYLNAKEDEEDETKIPEIIRVYAPDADRHVRDLRTEVRTTQVQDVLEGNLDSFLLSYLKTQEAQSAWNEE